MATPALSLVHPLPHVDDLPLDGNGYEPQAVADAFAAYRRHLAQLQAQLRVIQAATPSASPTGHPARMDALHLIRTAAEFADTLERDASAAAATQIERAAEETRRRAAELDVREASVDRYREESEVERAEMLNRARHEIEELRLKANHDAKQEVLEAEAKSRRLIEQARHQVAELSDSARAEVSDTLAWANDRSREIISQAQDGATKLLSAAGLGTDKALEVAEAIVASVTADSADKPVDETL